MSAPRRPRRRHARIAGLALPVLLALLSTGCQQAAPAAPRLTLFGSTTPSAAVAADANASELGVVFSSSEAGTVTGIRFYKSSSNRGPHLGTLWNASGRALAHVTFSHETSSGWQTASFSSPVKIVAGAKYVASYTAPTGHYSAKANGFAQQTKKGPLTVPQDGGVYSYAPGRFPETVYDDSNYLVDVVFEPDAAPRPRSTPSSNPSPSKVEIVSGTKVTVRPLDGGDDYYGRFTHGLPTSHAFFPIGVWMESVLYESDVAMDQAAGINTYVNPTPDSNLSIIDSSGSYSIADGSPLSNGFASSDEVDMWAGAGSDAWTGKYPGEGALCSPADGKCGYTVIKQLVARGPRGAMSYANYGKGITFWQTAAQARPFTAAVDLVSDDLYWFTDPGICGATTGGWGPGDGVAMPEATCRLAANYGWTVDKVRSLTEGTKPVWGFVEDGHPFTESASGTITGPQLRAAVWSSIINGARGIIYFNHDFGGSCISQHVLREACGAGIRPAVTSVDAQITALARVLNSPYLDGLISATGSVDTMAKAYHGSIYVFAASATAAAQTVRFTSACTSGTKAAVLGENRSVPVKNGVFTDSFADGNAVHIYRIAGACGL